MLRGFILSALVTGLFGATAQGPVIVAGPGSTPQGDYLRGVGCAAAGLGVLAERTAVADSINANTMITLNEYMANVARQERLEYAEHRRAERESIADARKKIQDRIRNEPELIDVMNGDALNSKLWDLLSPAVSDSASRYAEVPLEPEIIRRIPFRLAEKGETFSMSRLSRKGKGNTKWAVAFRDPQFAEECRTYQRAVDNALELAIDGKWNDGAIGGILHAVALLEQKLLATPHLRSNPDYQAEAGEARVEVNQLRKTAKLFQHAAVHQALAEIDNYHGTTVDEFRLFMRKHKLTFAAAETPDERTLYPQLYTALIEQHKKVVSPDAAPEK